LVIFFPQQFIVATVNNPPTIDALVFANQVGEFFQVLELKFLVKSFEKILQLATFSRHKDETFKMLYRRLLNANKREVLQAHAIQVQTLQNEFKSLRAQLANKKASLPNQLIMPNLYRVQDHERDLLGCSMASHIMPWLGSMFFPMHKILVSH